MMLLFKMGSTLKGNNLLLSWMMLLFEMGSTLKGKNLLHSLDDVAF